MAMGAASPSVQQEVIPSLLCQVLRKFRIPDFEHSWPKHPVPIVECQPGLGAAWPRQELQLELRARAAGSTALCPAGITACLSPAPGDVAQAGPRWHLAPQSGTMPQVLAKKALSCSWLKADGAQIGGSFSCPPAHGHHPAQSTAATSCAHCIQKWASQSKLSFAFSKSFSGLVGKDNIYFFFFK